MSNVKTIGLRSSDINKLISSLTDLSDSLDDLGKDIAKDVAESGLAYLQMRYAIRNRDVNNADIQTSIESTSTGYDIVASGKDVVYEEFGTGEIGKENPHDERSRYESVLNDYNSGPFVSTHINKKGRHYWFYKGYQEGMPAGMEMLHTSTYLQNGTFKDIVKKKASDVLSKV